MALGWGLVDQPGSLLQLKYWASLHPPVALVVGLHLRKPPPSIRFLSFYSISRSQLYAEDFFIVE